MSRQAALLLSGATSSTTSALAQPQSSRFRQTGNGAMPSEHCEQLRSAISHHGGARLPSETAAQQNGLRRLVHNRRIAFRCPDELVQSVQDAADRSGVGLPEYIRDLIRRDLRGA